MQARRILLAVMAVALAGCGRRDSPPSARPASAPAFASVPAQPTFNKDVAPIFFEHCVTCHQPGQGAPFSLRSYAEATSRADDIAHATSMRHMPPWLPDAIDPPFAGERRLTAEQIETIRRWVDRGAVEGEAKDRRAAPSLATGWQLGTPDLVVRPPRPYVLKPQDENVFRNLVMQVPLPAGRFVRAVEFQPGDAPVHHAVLHLDRTPASRRLDGADGQPGFDGMGAMGAQEPEGHFVGWAPGRGPIVSADGMPWKLERGTDLVLELHLIPRKAPVTIQPAVALYFAKNASAAMPLLLRMGSKAIDIPAGAHDYAIRDSYVLPADIDLLSLYPHAHFLGKDMHVLANLPDGTSKTLLHIARWSFHWQQDYRYVRPVALPRGTTISMRFTYDNSDGNKDNPHHPPVAVTVGQRSTDEMGNLLLQVVPHSAADRARLIRDFAAKEVTANIDGAEVLIRHNPQSAENQAFLGASYVDAGRVSEGIARLEYSLELDPRSPKAHNELGGALLKQNRAAEAVSHFQRAVSLSPRDDRLVFNLGKGFSALGRRADAARQFERALVLNPDLGEAHEELGVLLFAAGRVAEATAHLKRAVELMPDSAMAHSDLGGALAEAGKRDEAVKEIERALEIDPDYGPAKENLARLRK
jgi:Flp pilus assembly protein TadD/mono/diheme cytochrome c family protein